MRFSVRMVAEIHQGFWEAMANGAFFAGAVIEAGVDRRTGSRWLARCGGVRPRRGRNLKGRCLTFAEREDIAMRRSRGEGVREIASQVGRSPSTISRELHRNAERDGRYRASTAHALAYQRASRPKPAKLATNHELRDRVQSDLKKKRSPEQIADPAPGRVRRRSVDGGVHGEHLPVGVYAFSWRVGAGADPLSADGQGAAQTLP